MQTIDLRQPERATQGYDAPAFRRAAELLPYPTWTALPDGRLDWANAALSAATGLPFTTLVAGGMAGVVAPDDRDRFAALMAGCVAHPARFEVALKLRAGETASCWQRVTYAPVYGPDGVLVAFVASAADIETQVAAVEALTRDNEDLERDVFRQMHQLNESRGRLQTIFDNCPDILYLVRLSSAGAITFAEVNRAAGVMFAGDLHSLPGRPVDSVQAIESATSIAAHLRQALRGAAVHYVVEGRIAPAPPIVIQVVGVAVDYSNEEEGVVLFCGRDITQQRAAEDALRQSQKMEAVGQLTGGLAHDFNNLLTGIMGSLDLLETRLAQGRHDKLERYVRTAQEAAGRAASLTHRLLAFSRQQTLDPKPIDANLLVAGMEDLLRRTVGPEIVLEVAHEPGLWTVLVDVSQLENALLNLCINARDAMAQGGRIIVETRNSRLGARDAGERDLPAGDYVALSVSDNGSGMTPEVVARVFEPFFTTKPIGSGTGLGLSMIYGFARQSNGNVRIHSRPGLGTTVRMILPRHHGMAEKDAERAALSAAPRAGPGETVLIVDDEQAVRSLVEEVLEELGYATASAANGRDALELLRVGERYDLLVTDVGMPGGLNGRQVAEAARNMRPGLKILFITGYAEGAVLNQGQLTIGVQVLTKPFSMEVLASHVRRLLDED